MSSLSNSNKTDYVSSLYNEYVCEYVYVCVKSKTFYLTFQAHHPWYFYSLIFLSPYHYALRLSHLHSLHNELT